MNETEKSHDEIERLLKRVRPPRPSDELKEQVLQAGKEAWAAHPSHGLGRIALRRLVLSAAAAVLIVVLADAWSNATMARWRPPEPARMALTPDDRSDAEQYWADTWPEIPYQSLIGHMAGIGRPMEVNTGTMFEYSRKLQEALSQIDPI